MKALQLYRNIIYFNCLLDDMRFSLELKKIGMTKQELTDFNKQKKNINRERIKQFFNKL